MNLQAKKSYCNFDRFRDREVSNIDKSDLVSESYQIHCFWDATVRIYLILINSDCELNNLDQPDLVGQVSQTRCSRDATVLVCPCVCLPAIRPVDVCRWLWNGQIVSSLCFHLFASVLFADLRYNCHFILNHKTFKCWLFEHISIVFCCCFAVVEFDICKKYFLFDVYIFIFFDKTVSSL